MSRSYMIVAFFHPVKQDPALRNRAVILDLPTVAINGDHVPSTSRVIGIVSRSIMGIRR